MSFWQGPFQVVKKISELNYEIQEDNLKPKIVHVDRLRPFRSQNLEGEHAVEQNTEETPLETDTEVKDDDSFGVVEQVDPYVIIDSGRMQGPETTKMVE